MYPFICCIVLPNTCFRIEEGIYFNFLIPKMGIIHLQSFSLEFEGQILRALATSTF